LAADYRKVSLHGRMAWCKGNVFRKILTHGNCGPRKELAAGIKMTRSAVVARCKGNFARKYSTRDNVQQETWKGRTEGHRRWKGPECKTGIKDPTTNSLEGWSSGQKSHLGSGGTPKKILYEILRGEIAKQIAGNSSGLRRMMDWTLWTGRHTRKRKKKQHY
jgi:hypothetical protein